MAAAAKPPPAPVELEWCADFHDNAMPQEPPPGFPVLSFMPIHGFFIVMTLVNEKKAHWCAGNMVGIML